MSQTDYISKLLDIEDAVVDGVFHEPEHVTVSFSLKRRIYECPDCGTDTDIVHDYRIQIVKDVPVMGKGLIWRYRKRRYVCPLCGKKFYERIHILPKYHRITSRTCFYSFVKLQDRVCEKQIAKDLNVSQSTIHRWMNMLEYVKPKILPKVLSIDEFKGDADGEKFQCNIVDPVKKQILDILPERSEDYLAHYLKGFPNADRVECVVIDMNQGYFRAVRDALPNARIVIDKFHVARYSTWALENVRKRVQKALPDEYRKYFKRSRLLLLKKHSKLSVEESAAVNTMLDFSKELKYSYYFKERFYDFLASKDRDEAARKLYEINLLIQNSGIMEYRPLISVIKNWSEYILNAFEFKYTNGFVEGTNNKIKVLKRIAFSYRNFENLRRRILHMERNKVAP